MRKLILVGVLLGCGGLALAQNDDRLFLPRNFVRGFLDFQVAPPHNEPDLGLCSPGLINAGADRCGAFARYVYSGYIEFQPIGRGVFRRLFVLFEPKFFAGDNLPQQSYTASGAGILWERTIGVGIALPHGFELRGLNHRTKLMGRYSDVPSAVTRAPDGPYGMYSTIGVRWYFGGYGRAQAASR